MHFCGSLVFLSHSNTPYTGRIHSSLLKSSLPSLYLHYQDSPDKKSAQWKDLEDALSQRTHAVDQAGQALLQAKYSQMLED